MKKIVSILLALCMTVGAMSFTAMANTATNAAGKPFLYFNGVYSGNSKVVSIRRNADVTLKFTIIDTAVNYEDVKHQHTLPDDISDDVFYAAPECGYNSKGLPLRSDNSIRIYASPTEAGKVKFDIEFDVRYNGDDNKVDFTLFYLSRKNVIPEGSSTPVVEDTDHVIECSYTVTECRDYSVDNDEDDDDDDEPVLTPLTPYIIISNYSFGGGSVTAGTEFPLTLTLKNTSKEYDLDNIVMNISPQGVFSVASSSNTLYLESLKKDSTVTKTIDIKAGMTKLTDDDDSNSINLSFRFQYEANDSRFPGESTESITIPVDYPDRFQLGTLEYWDSGYVGDQLYVYLPMVNKGRSGIYNLTATLKGDMSNAGQSTYIGNLNAGTENGADFSFSFDTPGEKKCEIVVTYEDANMIERTVSKEFTFNIMSFEDMGMMEEFPPMDDPGMMEDEPAMVPTPELTPETIKAVSIISGVTLVGVGAFLLSQKRKQESLVDDEEI